MKRQFLLIVSVVLFGASIAAAQTMPAPVKQISAGVVNGKAVNLAKPEYPAAARAVNAEGAVNVRVVIDENGDVASATAVSGHPLLRQAAEQAARASKFNPTLLSGQAVKVTGVVVYNFATAKTSNWFQVGILLATLEKMPTLRYFDANVVASMIPADWTAEKQQLQRLNELKTAESEAEYEPKPKERIIGEKTSKSPGNLVTTTKITGVTLSPNKIVSSENAAIGQSLITSIEGRLAAEPVNLWYFDLGLNFNLALDKADSPSKDERLNSLKPFRQIIENAPADISKDVIDELRKMSSLMEKGVFTDADKISMSESLTKVTMIVMNQ